VLITGAPEKSSHAHI